jgi:hypothetical protein
MVGVCQYGETTMRRTIKHLVITIILTFTFLGQSFADCRPDYTQDVKTRIEKLEKSKKVAWYATGIGGGGMFAFWGVMGVLLVGPWGVLIGAQFGVLGALAGGPFYIYNKIKKSKLKKMAYMLQLLEELYGESDLPKDSNFLDMFDKLSKKKPGLSKDRLKEVLMGLNDNRALCNGSVAQYKKIVKSGKLTTPKRLLKYLKKEL